MEGISVFFWNRASNNENIKFNIGLCTGNEFYSEETTNVNNLQFADFSISSWKKDVLFNKHVKIIM